VDVGGYRFQHTQRLPADLVWSALKLPTQCYDWNCAQQCEGTTCYVIKDAYGNNFGYATGIETMLGQVEAAGGVGKQVFFASPLASIGAAPLVGPKAMKLHFKDGSSVSADNVVLNMPGNAIENLAQSSILFTQATKKVNTVLDSVYTGAMVKIYAWYEDAWWNTKLGLMEGYFYTAKEYVGDQAKYRNASVPEASSGPAPLEGRYHDGPQRCLIGHDTAGMPVYSGIKVQYGNCSGAIEVFYGSAVKYYANLMSDPSQPLTVVTSDASGKAIVEGGANDQPATAEAAAKLIDDVHVSLMTYHAKALKLAKIDPASIPKPKTCVLANWISDGKYTPGIGHLSGTDQDRKLARKPLKDYNLYIANQDYGYQSGWAVGSLSMAEKVMQAEVGLPKPEWLDAEFYKEWVTQEP
jgi:hypothetical protein